MSLTILALCLVTLWQPSPAAALTLGESMERATSETEASQLLRISLERAAAGEQIAFGELLPRLSATATLTRNDREVSFGDRISTQRYDWSAGARAEIDLFRGAAIPTWRASRFSTEAASERDQWQRSTLRFAAARAFIEASAAITTLDDAHDALEVSRETFEQMQQLADGGFRVQADVGQAQLSYLEAQAAVRSAERLVNDALAELAYLIGADELSAGDLEIDDAAVESLLSSGSYNAERRSDLRAFMHDMEAADARVRAQHLSLAPSVNLSAQANFGRPSMRAPEGVWWALALNLSWQIFEWGRYGAIEAAKLDRQALDYELQEERRRIERDEDLAARRFAEAEDQIELAVQAVAVAEENQRVARVRFDAGAVTALEVTIADNALFRARNRATTVFLERDLARLALLYQRGEI